MISLALLVSGLAGQPTDSPVSWSFGATLWEDGSVSVDMTAHIQKGWHLYATELPSDQGPLPTVFRIQADAAYEVLGGVQSPSPVEAYDPNFAMVVRYHSGAPVFQVRLMPGGREPFTVSGDVEYMVCDDRTCLPPVRVPFKVLVDPNGMPSQE